MILKHHKPRLKANKTLGNSYKMQDYFLIQITKKRYELSVFKTERDNIHIKILLSDGQALRKKV
jgi:hypothetical protein